MSDLNVITLTGRLGGDPELRYTTAGTAVLTLRVASNHVRGRGEEQKKETCWIDCVAFGHLAEFVSQYGRKGQEIGLSGRLQYREWEDCDGNKRAKHEIVVEHVKLGPNKFNQEEE